MLRKCIGVAIACALLAAPAVLTADPCIKVTYNPPKWEYIGDYCWQEVLGYTWCPGPPPTTEYEYGAIYCSPPDPDP